MRHDQNLAPQRWKRGAPSFLTLTEDKTDKKMRPARGYPPRSPTERRVRARRGAGEGARWVAARRAREQIGRMKRSSPCAHPALRLARLPARCPFVTRRRMQ